MIKIKINQDFWDSTIEQFVTVNEVFSFENSLCAISKWESKWKVPFLNNDKKTTEQVLDYFVCMCLTPNFRKEYLSDDVVSILNSYIEISHTATTLPKAKKTSNQVYTSELLYAYMALNGIPFECDQWEINRLLMLLGCISNLTNPSKKPMRSSAQIARSYADLNRARQKKYNTKG